MTDADKLNEYKFNKLPQYLLVQSSWEWFVFAARCWLSILSTAARFLVITLCPKISGTRFKCT